MGSRLLKLRRYCVVLPAGLVLGLVLQACTVIDVRNTTVFSNDRGAVSPATLQAIAKGETSADWLLRHLGYPERITPKADNMEVWHYRVQERRDNLYRLILVFQYRSADTYQRDIYIKLVDQVVMDAWGDFDFRFDADAVPEPKAGPPAGSPVINRKKRTRALSPPSGGETTGAADPPSAGAVTDQ